MKGRNGQALYDLAELYDIAYDWEIMPELMFYIECMRQFGRCEVESMLEPACGTGRNLIALAEMEIRTTAWDINQGTIDLARKKLDARGLLDFVDLHCADMSDFQIDHLHDGGFCSINSFRYLLEDSQILNHLNAVCAMLRPGAVYILDFSYAMAEDADCPDYHWVNDRDGLVLDVRWTTSENHPTRRSHEVCTVKVRDSEGRETTHVSDHLSRLWLEEEFLGILDQSGFELRGICDGNFQPLSDDVSLDGSLENLYHILQKV